MITPPEQKDAIVSIAEKALADTLAIVQDMNRETGQLMTGALADKNAAAVLIQALATMVLQPRYGGEVAIEAIGAGLGFSLACVNPLDRAVLIAIFGRSMRNAGERAEHDRRVANGETPAPPSGLH